MYEREGSREWPLVIFTTALQLACGLAIVTTVFDFSANPAPIGLSRVFGIAILPTVAAGVLASLLHLGHPWLAWKAFCNFGRSRLSVEIVLTSLFGAAALLDSFLWWSGRIELRAAIGVATSILGLAAVLSSAAVYMIPSQPLWRSGWLLSSFVGTLLAVGGGLGATCGAQYGTGVLQIFLGLVIAGGLLSFVSAFWMRNVFRRLAHGKLVFAQLQAIPTRRNAGSWLSFVLYVLLTGILPVVLAAAVLPVGATGIEVAALRLAPAAVAAMIAGAMLGRSLMYSTGTALSRF
ncbi:MAG TPA: DmsC/YnfH family molybdoenzyme membrane anchor subunit [Terriglobales bacterium]|nr:DmsC/YnfH family molybdoenzyme membrane anchor subunit [Terriglobales bacterium]